MIVHCQYCRGEIKITESRYKRGNGRFCSNGCRLKAKARIKVNLICANCGNEFQVWKRERIKNTRFCSLKCAGEYKRRKIEFICCGCGKALKRTPADIKKNMTGRYFCTFGCYDKYRFNKQLSANLKVHYRLPYSLKKEILKRDNYTCQRCGRKPHDLTVDHMIPVHYFVTRYRTVEACLKAGVNEPSNLQTLCFECNHRKGIQVINPAKIAGVAVANIAKVKGVA